jgi:anti-sigma factor ChrR (cupin superfamily)
LTTNCVFPPELDEKQLLAYLDDRNANQETAHHLEICPHCRQRANALDSLQKRLTTRLYRATCPSPTELGEFHLRMLPGSQMLLTGAHLRECPHCRQELSALEEFLGERAPQQGVPDPLKVLLAPLLPNQVALRGEASSAQVFQVEDIVISLEPQWTPKGEVSLQGLIAADDQEQWKGATVELQQDYLASVISYVDEFGGFSFQKIVPTSTQVIITSPAGTTVQTEKVKLTI